MENTLSKKQGIIYVLSNPCMPGLVKIGKTTRTDVNDRMKELFSTGVPVPFVCEYSCTVNNCDLVEKELHKAFGVVRVNNNREFFRLDPKSIIGLISLFSIEEVTNEINKEIENNLTSNDKIAQFKEKKLQRGPLNFYEMGLKDGDVLVYKKDNTIKCIVSGNRTVLYDNEEYYLTSITEKVCNDKGSPTSQWIVEKTGVCLRNLYNDIQMKDEPIL